MNFVKSNRPMTLAGTKEIVKMTVAANPMMTRQFLMPINCAVP